MLSPGVVLNDRYVLNNRVATGGMGEVWSATDTLLNRTVAVKVLQPELVSDTEFITRFRAEARSMAALRHPGIAEVYDYGENAVVDGDRVDYIVMAYIEGVSLARRIETLGPLSVAETLSVVTQAAHALHAAHRAGIVHRDVKPSNLLIQADTTVVLVDFGVARSAAVTDVTGSNVVLGTPHFMAPEQISGQPVSPATDVYALGAVMYCCLTGRPPFTGANALQVVSQHLKDAPPALPPEVPAPVAALVTRALAKELGDRFPSAAAFADAAQPAAGVAPPTVDLGSYVAPSPPVPSHPAAPHPAPSHVAPVQQPKVPPEPSGRRPATGSAGGRNRRAGIVAGRGRTRPGAGRPGRHTGPPAIRGRPIGCRPAGAGGRRDVGQRRSLGRRRPPGQRRPLGQRRSWRRGGRPGREDHRRSGSDGGRTSSIPDGRAVGWVDHARQPETHHHLTDCAGEEPVHPNSGLRQRLPGHRLGGTDRIGRNPPRPGVPALPDQQRVQLRSDHEDHLRRHQDSCLGVPGGEGPRPQDRQRFVRLLRRSGTGQRRRSLRQVGRLGGRGQLRQRIRTL
jgi:predicted Ser/Thr protein kinase